MNLTDTGTVRKKDKILINDTVLFKQLSKILGKGEALKQILIAYNGYDLNKWPRGIRTFDISVGLLCSFNWMCTPQRSAYWLDLYKKIEDIK